MVDSSAVAAPSVNAANEKQTREYNNTVDETDDDFSLPQPKHELQSLQQQIDVLNHNNNNNDSSSLQLLPPQPYRYVRYDQIESTLSLPIEKGTLCWVLLSQGKNRTSRLFKPARVVQVDSPQPVQQATQPQDQPQNDPRICVQYPKGSTYWVKTSNLVPVLEQHHHLILVASETNDYRRLAIVHTTSNDHFIEIGCDFGILVDSVRHAKSTLGVDKSEASIDIARQQYPNREFILGDVFLQQDLGLPYTHHLKEPLVVAIDINGNRDLPAVLKCIELVFTWSPRLIIVKSRALYSKMGGGRSPSHKDRQA
jgi:hypothetical protein